jgi:adenine deaminase
MALPTRPAPHVFNDETVTRQRLVRVALGYEEADLILRGAKVLNMQTLAWKENWDIVVSGQRIAWTGPQGTWPGTAKETVSVAGLWAVPGFGEPHKHIESTMISPEYEADLVLRFEHRSLARVLECQWSEKCRVLAEGAQARQSV